MASLFRPPESHRSHPNTPKLRLPSLVNDVESPSTNNTIFQRQNEPTIQRPTQTKGNIYNSTNIYNNTIRKPSNPLSMDTNTNTNPPAKPNLLSLPLQMPIVTSANSAISPSRRSSSISPSKSPISLKKRPAPPPIPHLNMNTSINQPYQNSIPSAKGKRPPPLMNTNGISESLKSLNLNSDSNATTVVANTPIDNKNNMENSTTTTTTSANKSLYSREEYNDSSDSYFSNILSTYEEKSSSTTSPQKISPLSTGVIEGTNTTSSSSRTLTLDSIFSQSDVDQLDESIWKYSNIRNEIVTLGVLGEGAGGSVAKCKLKTGNKVFALKTINTLNTDPEFQKQIFRELQFNRSFKSNYIVRYYGMFRDELNSSIYIAMEYMGGKSLEAVYKNLLDRGGRIGEKVLGKIAEDVLRGLSYLHEKKVIHRDIKPQNILFNDEGEVKLCDFGVSGEAVNSLATTFTGTSFYMAPERIQGEPYSVTCDVWSLGLTILEVAQGHFPFGSDKITANIAPIELLVMILTFTPELKDEPENNISWSNSFKSFIEYCLKKDPRERPSPRQMLKHPWIQGQMKKKVNMSKFIKRCWDNE